MAKKFWLMKSEPEAFGIEDLKRKKREHWDGVRNYQARNFMREMKVGDDVLFYHSNAKPPGVVGLAKVVTESYPDHTAWDQKSKYHDPQSPRDNPRWFMVDVEFVEAWPGIVSLHELRELPGLEEMIVTKRSRLSVQPVTADEFRIVCRVGRAKARQGDT